MRNSWKKTKQGMCFCMIMTLLCGCTNNQVNYNLEEGSGNETAEGRKEAVSSLSQFAEAEKWKEEWEIDTENNGKITLKVAADISVPDADTMSVVDVKAVEINADYKKQLLAGFFENGEIYYHDLEHKTKEELETELAGAEDYLNMLESESDMNVVFTKSAEELKEEIQEIQFYLKIASDNYTPAEEFDSCNEYLGYLNDIPYLVEFGGGDGWTDIIIMPQDDYYGPEVLKEKEAISHYIADTTEADKNLCKFSMEEAQELADQMAAKLGFENQVCTAAENVQWTGAEAIGEAAYTNFEEALYGYCFTYGTGVDGVAFRECKLKQTEDVDSFFSLDYAIGSEEDWADIDYEFDMLRMEVNDMGVASIRIINPVSVTKITSEVELLPLDTIKKIMKNEAQENSREYEYFSTNVMANRMELVYYKVEDKNESGVGSYIPVWCLIPAGTYFHPILVNAIDGSIIYYWK